MRLKFPNKDKMWDFIDSNNLSNYSANNLTATLTIDNLSDSLKQDAVTKYQASEL